MANIHLFSGGQNEATESTIETNDSNAPCLRLCGYNNNRSGERGAGGHGKTTAPVFNQATP